MSERAGKCRLHSAICALFIAIYEFSIKKNIKLLQNSPKILSIYFRHVIIEECDDALSREKLSDKYIDRKGK